MSQFSHVSQYCIVLIFEQSLCVRQIVYDICVFWVFGCFVNSFKSRLVTYLKQFSWLRIRDIIYQFQCLVHSDSQIMSSLSFTSVWNLVRDIFVYFFCLHSIGGQIPAPLMFLKQLNLIDEIMKIDLDTCSTSDSFRRLWEIASHEHVKVPMFGFEEIRRMDNMILSKQDTFSFLLYHFNLYLYYFSLCWSWFLVSSGTSKTIGTLVRSKVSVSFATLGTCLRRQRDTRNSSSTGTAVSSKTDSCRIPEKFVGHYVYSSLWHCGQLSWTLRRRCT